MCREERAVAALKRLKRNLETVRVDIYRGSSCEKCSNRDDVEPSPDGRWLHANSVMNEIDNIIKEAEGG